MSKKTINLMLGGATPNVIVTTAKTWGEFKIENQNDFEFPDPHAAIIGETKAVLINESLLPNSVEYKGKKTDSFHIYVTPIKSKSGKKFDDTPYRECKSIIKSLREKYDVAHKFFGDYTHMTTIELRSKLNKWIKRYPNAKALKASQKVVKTPVKKAVKKVIKKTTPKKVVKAETITPTKVENSIIIDSNSDIIEVLEQVLDFLRNTNKGNRVIFTLDEVEPSDYNKMKTLMS